MSDREYQNVLQWSQSKETDGCGQEIDEDRDKMDRCGPLVKIANEARRALSIGEHRERTLSVGGCHNRGCSG